MPPALPPRDPARTPDAPEPDHPASSGLLVELELLRRTVTRLGDELDGLRRAMESRGLIDQAKGAVRAVTGASDDEAFALLAARSQRENRKLVAVAADVLAAVDLPADRHTSVSRILHLAEPSAGVHPEAPQQSPWHPRRRFDQGSLAVADPRQLRALADLAEQLTGAEDRHAVVEVLVGPGAAALGAFAASVAAIGNPGTAAVEADGLALAEASREPIRLDAMHPVAEALRSGRPLLLSRAELALSYPAHPRPERLQGLAVLALTADTARPTAWSLWFDHPVPADPGTRAMLARSGRLASTALRRAR